MKLVEAKLKGSLGLLDAFVVNFDNGLWDLSFNDKSAETRVYLSSFREPVRTFSTLEAVLKMVRSVSPLETVVKVVFY